MRQSCSLKQKLGHWTYLNAHLYWVYFCSPIKQLAVKECLCNCGGHDTVEAAWTPGRREAVLYSCYYTVLPVLYCTPGTVLYCIPGTVFLVLYFWYYTVLLVLHYTQLIYLPG